MDDLKDRLRASFQRGRYLLDEAADRIEALEAQLTARDAEIAALALELQLWQDAAREG